MGHVLDFVIHIYKQSRFEMLRNFSDISLMSVDRSISSNIGQKAWVEPWLPLGQVHVYKYMFTINILKFIIKKN